ncbi:MAG: hypothetical protein Ta2G_04490 [Termitinemataceae bacterium]|nr:MAG: hypothetical protein Ta2G_04490 [Termitinemataceae bacterium]
MKIRSQAIPLSILFILFSSTGVFAQHIEEFLMQHNDEKGFTIYGYTGNLTDIVIPSKYLDIPITEIYGGVFTGTFDNKNLTSIEIPSSVKKLNRNSFINNPGLERVKIGSNVDIAGAFDQGFDTAYYREGNKGGEYKKSGGLWVLETGSQDTVSTPVQNIASAPPIQESAVTEAQVVQAEAVQETQEVQKIPEPQEITEIKQTPKKPQLWLPTPNINNLYIPPNKFERPIERAERPIDRVERPINRVERPINRVERSSIDKFDRYTFDMRVHKILPRETLSSIARLYWGEENSIFFPLIIFANSSITNPDDIKVFDLIFIPDLQMSRMSGQNKREIVECFYRTAGYYSREGNNRLAKTLMRAAQEWSK